MRSHGHSRVDTGEFLSDHLPSRGAPLTQDLRHRDSNSERVGLLRDGSPLMTETSNPVLPPTLVSRSPTSPTITLCPGEELEIPTSFRPRVSVPLDSVTLPLPSRPQIRGGREDRRRTRVTSVLGPRTKRRREKTPSLPSETRDPTRSES